MADKKISALTAATTPLAGTEVLPIVQSGSTVKVSVANLTAGRAVGMAGGSFTDNIVQNTAAKGVNFTANTPASGMTSQLLNWYEEGTWTPQDSGGNAIGDGTYTRIGRLVTLNIVINANSVSTAYIQNIPFAKSGDYFGGYFTRALRGNTISNGFSCRVMVGFTSTTTIDFLTNVSSGADAAFTLTTEASGTVRVGLVVTYTV